MESFNEKETFNDKETFSEKESLTYEESILKVRGGENPTDPTALSRAILKVLSKNSYVVVKSVGPRALNITMEAFRKASIKAESRQKGVVLVCRQSEYDAIVAGKRTLGVDTRIFGIAVKNVL